MHDDGSGVVNVRATLDAQAVAEAEVGRRQARGPRSVGRPCRGGMDDLAVGAQRIGYGADRAVEAVLVAGPGGRDHRRGERAERPREGRRGHEGSRRDVDELLGHRRHRPRRDRHRRDRRPGSGQRAHQPAGRRQRHRSIAARRAPECGLGECRREVPGRLEHHHQRRGRPAGPDRRLDLDRQHPPDRRCSRSRWCWWCSRSSCCSSAAVAAVRAHPVRRFEVHARDGETMR